MRCNIVPATIGLSADRFLFLVLAIIISGVGELAHANPAKTFGGNLRALCKGKHTDFRNVGDLRNLVHKTTSEEAEDCPEQLIKALRELEQITRDTYACSVYKARAITKFYETYLRNANGQTDYERLPSAMVRFAVAYGMRLSNICRKHLINEFIFEADKRLGKQGFKELGPWASKRGPIGRLLSTIKKPDDIILPNDLSSVFTDDSLMEKLRLKVQNDGKVNRLRELCLKRFKPLYDNMMIPLAIMSSSGLDYRQLSLITDLKLRSKAVSKVALWSRVVFLCETLTTVEVVEAPQRGQPLRHISGWRDVTPVARDGRMPGGAPAVGLQQPTEIKPVEPYFPLVRIGDEIMGHLDLRLKTIVLVFDKKKTEAQRMREKLLKRGWSLLFARFKYGEIKALIKLKLKEIKVALTRRGKLDMVHNELLDLLDAKDETTLFRFVSKVERAKMSVARWLVVTILIRCVFALLIAAMVVSGSGHDKIEVLNNKLKKYKS